MRGVVSKRLPASNAHSKFVPDQPLNSAVKITAFTAPLPPLCAGGAQPFGEPHVIVPPFSGNAGAGVAPTSASSSTAPDVVTTTFERSLAAARRG